MHSGRSDDNRAMPTPKQPGASSDEARVSIAPPSTSSDVFKVGVRVPPFWPEEPEIWFSQIEGQFAIAGITSDLTKFHYVISQLDRQFSKEVKDIITNPPATDKYPKLKSELISRLSDTNERQIQQLLHHEELGERKPSQFLRHLQGLAANRISDDVLRMMWTNRLPGSIQTVLAAHPTASLEILADLADRIHDIGPRCACTSHVASTSHSHGPDHPGSSMDAMAREIAELRKQVQALRTGDHRRGRSRSRTRNHSRKHSRSSTRSQSSYRKFPVCWYHSKHGDDANRCVRPCDYGKSGNAAGSR